MRDSTGELKSTYPQFSYPMFLSLHKSLQDYKNFEQNTSQQPFIQSATRVVVTKREGEYEIEIFDGQLLSARLSSALLGLNSKILESASEEETQIAENITLKINEETPGQYILFDSQALKQK